MQHGLEKHQDTDLFVLAPPGAFCYPVPSVLAGRTRRKQTFGNPVRAIVPVDLPPKRCVVLRSKP